MVSHIIGLVAYVTSGHKRVLVTHPWQGLRSDSDSLEREVYKKLP